MVLRSHFPTGIALTSRFRRRFSLRPNHFFHINRGELVGIVTVRRATRRTQAGFRLPNPVPTPHAHLIPAFAWIEFAIRQI
jgi:hypothetical protein